ncbi:WbqC family protein [Phenylobacterium sp.]|uniref:WbqC family protein n=1 Tax=Phenylobacterium sp. TaxID=1871053 RepID=UPI002718CB6C|nr:WbqC family protein [Phenylobacterium sp.]MDO8801673.1 WbqC family protein [Phenylobacterium sp.]
MIAAIMQPYLLPYIGYFQLIAAADVFVVYDDVQYMRGGWINRNRILLNGAPHWLTLPVAHSGEVRTQIRDTRYQLSDAALKKLSGQLDAAYRKAPRAAAVKPLLDAILATPEPNVALFNEAAIRTVCDALGIGTRIVRSSAIGRDTALTGQDAVLDICRTLGADHYLNAAGGVDLYQAQAFAEQGVRLSFIASQAPPYRQFAAPFVANLSIADVLMFCEPDQLAQQVAAHSLVAP